ncbi:MAG: helix-turn-helix domain-containing protein [Acetobacterium woodii]|nr:helix-turn-helix domain-containing protein [Acetobacterium woodii]
MINVGDRLKNRRLELDLTLEEVGKVCGVSKSTVKKWESGEIENMKRDKIVLISKALKVNPIYVLGMDEENAKMEKNNRIPVLGNVAAGVPIEEIVDIKGYVEIPEWMLKRGNYFALKIKGRSMEPNIQDGDIIIVREQRMVENDEIAVVTVNSEDATVKQIKRLETGLMLIPHNRDYEPKFYTADEVENKPVEIIGKVVELRRGYEKC